MHFVGLILIAVGGLMALLSVIMGIGMAAGGELGVLPVALVAGVIGAGIAYGGWRLRRRATAGRISAQPAVVHDRVGNYLADEVETREIDGRACEVFYTKPTSGKHARPSMLVISVHAASPVEFSLKRETRFDRWGKQMLLARELQTGDEEFDDLVYVRAPLEGFAAQLLADRRKRAAVRLLLNTGFDCIAYEPDRIVAMWPKFDPAKDDRPQLIDDASQWLHALGLELPSSTLGDPAPDGDLRKIVYRGLWVALVAFAVVGVCTFMYPPLRTRELVLPTLAAWIALTAVFGVLAGLVLRGASTSHDLWGKLMKIGVFLLAAGSVGSVAAINGRGDAAPPDKVSVTVIDKRISRGRRNSRTYYAEVPAWDRPGDTLEFSVPRLDYDRIAPGRSQMELVVGRGRLGIAWVKSKRVIP